MLSAAAAITATTTNNENRNNSSEGVLGFETAVLTVIVWNNGHTDVARNEVLYRRKKDPKIRNCVQLYFQIIDELPLSQL